MEPLHWQSLQYIHTEKTTDWYWIVGIVGMTVAIIAVILNDSIFALLIVVSCFSLLLYGGRKPLVIENTLTNKGVYKGEIFHPYAEIESFYIEIHDKYPRIIFKLKSKLSQLLTILIHPEDSDQIQDFLEYYLPEEKLSESLLEKILIYIGF